MKSLANSPDKSAFGSAAKTQLNTKFMKRSASDATRLQATKPRNPLQDAFSGSLKPKEELDLLRSRLQKAGLYVPGPGEYHSTTKGSFERFRS